MNHPLHEVRQVLAEACTQAGLDCASAQLLRAGENTIFTLPGQLVARVSRPGTLATARREIQVARWLAAHQVPAVTALDIDQPVPVAGRAVTFWHQLPPHRHGTPGEVAGALRRLHPLPAPASFPALDPFVRLAERIDGASTLRPGDRAWLRAHLAELVERYRQLPAGLPACVVHGDAWVGNVVTTAAGDTVLLDLERCSLGPPEWDLVSTAIKHTSFAWITEQDYGDFAGRYGHDVTSWPGFELLRDIRELRMTAYLAQHAAENPAAREEAELRVACLRGDLGARPWSWTPAL